MKTFKIGTVRVWAVFTLALLLLLACGMGRKLWKGEAIFPPKEITVKTETPIENYAHHGEDFIILDETTGENLTISAIQYVEGAVAAEMPPTFHIEALKAQALSAYTRARYLKALWENEKEHPMGEAYFSQNPTKNQGFLYKENAKKLYGENFPIYWSKIEEAAAYAIERELTWEDEPILAAYHAMSAGATENCDNVWQQSLPYLTSVESEGDVFAKTYRETKSLTTEETKRILIAAFPKGNFKLGEEEGYFKIKERSRGGYVTKIEVGGFLTHGIEVRKAFDLRSSAFEIEATADGVIFTTYGYGHGVGLSQNGADFMARQGKNADEILRHYYKGATVKLKSKFSYNG